MATCSASDQIVVNKSNATPGLQGVFDSLREHALAAPGNRPHEVPGMGVSTNDVFNTLQVYLGSYYVNNYNEFGRSWQVNVMADRNFRCRVEQIKLLKVANRKGEMVPLGTLLQIGDAAGPVMLLRYNMYSAAAVTGGLSPGTSSGEGIALMDAVPTQP